MGWLPLPTPDGDGGPGPAKLDGVLDRVLGALGGPSLDAIVVIHERWADIVGAEVAGMASPLGVEDGVLRIRVVSAGWASHLRWAEQEILRRLDDLLGPGEVTGVTVRVARA